MKTGLLFWGGYVSFILILGMLLTRGCSEPQLETRQPVVKQAFTSDTLSDAVNDTIHDTVYIEPEIVFVTDTTIIYVPVIIRVPVTPHQVWENYKRTKIIERHVSNPNLNNGNT